MGRYKIRPCPGCGKEDNRPENELCYQCRTELNAGRKAIARYKELKEAGERVRVAVGYNWRYDKRFMKYFPSSFGNDLASAVLDAIARIAYAEKLSAFSSTDRNIYASDDRHTGMFCLDLLPAQADAVEDLLKTISDICAGIASNADADGKRWLEKLASGKISFEELQDPSARKR